MRERGVFLLRIVVCALIALVVMIAPASAHPAERLVGGAVGEGEIRLAGLLDGRRDKLKFDEGIAVSINDVAAVLDIGGRYSVDLPPSPYYRVKIEGEAIFDMVQTFGHAELVDPHCKCLSVPAIELVGRKKDRIELFFGGDSMAGRRYFAPRSDGMQVLNRETLAQDLDDLLVAIKPYWSESDITSINLESVVAASEPGPPAPKKYLFFTPPEAVHAFARAGIDHVSLGNNHTADYRAAGLATTIKALDSAGVAFSGAGMDIEQAEAASILPAGDRTVAIYGFVGWRGTWEPNQTATESKAGAAWGQSSVVDRVTRRERKAGHIPIMQFHGNIEYSDRPSAMSLPRYRLAIEKGAPLVIGHHPHVTHGLELYRGGLIAHSLGNFMFDQDHPHTHNSFALKVWLEKSKFLRAEAVPINILDYRPVPATGGMRQASLKRLYWLSAEMGTRLVQSGGHAVVWRSTRREAEVPCIDEPSTALRLQASCIGPAHRNGRNIVPRGDFENTNFGEARDRYWRSYNAGLDFRRSTAGEGMLAVLPEDAAKPFYLFSQSYVRDIYATEFTLKARLRIPHDASVELLVKDRPLEGEAASRSHEGEKVAGTSVSGSEDWQEISLDFTRPVDPLSHENINVAGAARAFRPILRITYDDPTNASTRMLIDDFALIEWPEDAAQTDPAKAWLWTHSRAGAHVAASPPRIAVEPLEQPMR